MATREAILANVKTTLEGITTESGYNNDIGLVSREVKDWANIRGRDSYPAIFVSWSIDDKEPETVADQYILSRLNVVLRGVYQADSGLETGLNDFLEDIEKAMCADQKRGGNAEYTVPSRATVYKGEDSTVLIFDFEFEILYVYVYGSP